MKKKLLSFILACSMLACPLTAFAEETAGQTSVPEETDSQEAEPEETDSQTSVPEETDSQEAKPEEQIGEVTEPITVLDKPYLSLGANLTEEQRNTVLGLLDIDSARLEEYNVIYTTIDEEYQYLGSYLSADTIGQRSLSSVLVVKREQGHGINITTKNISYCTIGMYKNALITAGITDADIIVAAPFPISGTAALVGALKAYSVMTGEAVSEESTDAALNELVLTGDLADTLGDSQQAEEFIAYLKQQIVEQKLDSQEEIQEAVEKAGREFKISLSEEDIQKVTSLLQKISELDLDLDTLMDQAKDLYDKLAEMGESSGFFAKIQDFFNTLIEYIKGLFD